MNIKHVMRFESPAEMSVAALSMLAGYAQMVIRARGRVNIALSGGSSPLGLYALIAKGGNLDLLPWHKVHFYWGDERFVPFSDTESNFGSAQEAFLKKLWIPPENLHPVDTALPDAAAAAAAYREELALIDGEPIPSFDLIVLGVGKDGHTASLFPNSQALRETTLAAVDCPPPHSSLPALPRVTVTLPVLDKAKKLFIISTGAEKLHIIDYILSEFTSEIRYPVQMIKNENINWFISNQ